MSPEQADEIIRLLGVLLRGCRVILCFLAAIMFLLAYAGLWNRKGKG